MKTNSAAKRFLAMFLCIVFCFALLPSAAFAEDADVPAGAQAEEAEVLAIPEEDEINDTIPDLPEAEVTEVTPLETVQVDGKDAALEAEYLFSAAEPTAEQLAYYGNWYADFRVSFDQNVDAESFGLYGAYGEYGVGFLYPNALAAGQTELLLEKAKQEPITYSDVAELVKTFTCGVWNKSAANVGATITVELIIWDPDDANTIYTIATEKYTFVAPPYPEASIESISPETGIPIFDIDTKTETGEKADLEAEYKFTQAKEPTELQLSYYGGWSADFRVSFDRPVAANTVGLYGAYEGWGYDLKVGFRYPEALGAGQKVSLLNLADFSLNYNEIVNVVQEFTCGVWNESPDNFGTTITVELVIWDPDDVTKEHVVTTESYTFKGPQLPEAEVTEVTPLETVQVDGKDVPLEAEYLFSAVEPTEAQLAYYGKWYADFRVSFDQSVEAESFGLYGAYGEYGVGFLYPNDLAADQTELLLAKAKQEPITYSDVAKIVKAFTCGVWNESADNIGKTITVELIIWDPNDANAEPAVLSTTKYTFQKPDLPTAKVEAVENPRTGVPLYDGSYQQTGETADLEAEYVFTPDAPTDLQLAYYRNWAADFRISFDDDLAANSFGLAGAYNGYGHEFNVGFLFPQNVKKGEPIQLMASAGFTGDRVITYNDLVNNIKVFNCGVFNRSVDNIGKTIKVELIIWDPAAPEDVHVVNTTSYTFQGCTLTLTSQDTDGNTGIATLTGGGRFFKNSEVTVTAPDQPGYSFLGWYKDSYSGQPVSAAAAYTFVIREDMNLVAVYENAGTGLLHIIGSKYEVDDSGPQESSADFDKPVGKKVNLIYTGTDFQYWVNISNNIISTTPEYTFTMVGETTIRLVTSRDLETQQSVYVIFLNAYDQVLSTERILDEEGAEDAFPGTIPSKMGVVFEKWVFEGTDEEATPSAIAAKISDNNPVVKIVPKYTEPSETYTLTVKVKTGGNVTDVEGYTELAVPAGVVKHIKVSEIAEAAGLSADDFSYWSLNEIEEASYNKTEYTVIGVKGKAFTVTAVFDGAAEEKATVLVTQMFSSLVDGAHKISATMYYNVPEGSTVHETGFVYSTNTSFSTDPDSLVIGAENARKHISYMTENTNMYTVNFNAGADSNKTVYLRAFVIYTDDNNEMYTIYSDLYQGSYSSLQGN